MKTEKKRYSSRNFSNSGVKTKKKFFFVEKYAQNFTNSGIKTEKKVFIAKYANSELKIKIRKKKGKGKKGLHRKIYEKTIIAHEYWVDDEYFGGLRPQTALQWHRASYFLWGTILARKHIFRLGGHKQ